MFQKENNVQLIGSLGLERRRKRYVSFMLYNSRYNDNIKSDFQKSFVVFKSRQDPAIEKMKAVSFHHDAICSKFFKKMFDYYQGSTVGIWVILNKILLFEFKIVINLTAMNLLTLLRICQESYSIFDTWCLIHFIKLQGFFS